MQEAEVSLLLALHYIRNGLTKVDVKVSIDGAHVKTGNRIHFDIFGFLEEHRCKKLDTDAERWQGIYQVEHFEPKLQISSVPGIGDVNIKLLSGEMLYVESKKGKSDKKGQEYSLMREAIGQLMTGVEITEDIIPVVAVPYTTKSYELADRWSKLDQIQNVGIKFFLIKDDGSVKIV